MKLYGATSVANRSFMVHADEDDLGKGGHSLSLTTGNGKYLLLLLLLLLLLQAGWYGLFAYNRSYIIAFAAGAAS